MMRDGPIPFFVHGAIEYVAAAAFIVVPFLLSYDSGTATGVSIAVGVLILVITASTDSPTGLMHQIPRSAHMVLDFLLVAALIALPFVTGFSSETAPTAFFISLGVAHLLVTLGTRFRTTSAA
ncbi:MAG: SPW repeat domain-containing protein [Thermoleophilaceae bacterium]